MWRTSQLDKQKQEISECEKSFFHPWMDGRHVIRAATLSANALIVVTATDHFLPTTVKQNRLDWMVSLRRVFCRGKNVIHARTAPYTSPSHRPVVHRTQRFLGSSNSSSIGSSVNNCTIRNSCSNRLLQDDSSWPQDARDIDDRKPGFQNWRLWSWGEISRRKDARLHLKRLRFFHSRRSPPAEN